MANQTVQINTGNAGKTKRSKSKTVKKSSSKKKTTQMPVVRYLRYDLVNSATPGTETSHYIDLARDLSAINRRLMRQGRSYHVKRVSVVSSNTIAQPGQNAGRATFSVIPHSWVAVNAWRRGFTAWRNMQNMAMKTTGNNILPTWNDYKIYMSADHASGTKPVPLDNGGNALTLGEWSISVYQSPDGTTASDAYYATMLGDHVGAAGTRTSIGLIQSYGDSRATVNNDSPTVPATATDDPLNNLFDAGTQVDEIISDIRTKGEDSPYALSAYAGGSTNHPKPLVVQQTTLGSDGRASVGGFVAMCGLIEVEITSPIAADSYSVLIELAEGSYRGIAADVI